METSVRFNFVSRRHCVHTLQIKFTFLASDKHLFVDLFVFFSLISESGFTAKLSYLLLQFLDISRNTRTPSDLCVIARSTTYQFNVRTSHCLNKILIPHHLLANPTNRTPVRDVISNYSITNSPKHSNSCFVPADLKVFNVSTLTLIVLTWRIG